MQHDNGTLSLFDLTRVGFAGQDPPRARNRDRGTAHAAAESLNARAVGTRCRAYLTVIMASGCQGATRDEIAEAVGARGAEDRALSRRVTDLLQAGLVVDSGRTRPGLSRREQTVWLAVGACEEAA